MKFILKMETNIIYSIYNKKGNRLIMQKKKIAIICAVVCGLFLTTNNMNVYANTNIDVKSSNQFIDTFKLENSKMRQIDDGEVVSALYEVNEDGVEIPIDTDIRLEYKKINGNEHVMSVKSSTPKSSTGEKTKDGVTLTGKISWTDVSGTNNILNYVSGTCTGSYEYNSYSYGTGPYFINTTWHKQANFGPSFYDISNAGKTANSFVLEITARAKDKSNFVLHVYTRLRD